MLRIIVVDDEQPIREWYTYSIGNISSGYVVVASCASGAEAYEAIMAEHPDLVITDIKMPGMSGIELMQKVRGEYGDIAFIILTNHAEFSYAQQAVAFGAQLYLLKSEVRTSDIQAALAEVEQTLMQRQTSSGLHFSQWEDLHKSDSAFVQWCINAELDLHGPYGVLAMSKPIYQLDLHKMKRVAELLLRAGAVEEGNYPFFVFSHARLPLSIQVIAQTLAKELHCCVGLAAGTHPDDFSDCLLRAKLASQYEFFESEQVVYFYEVLLQNGKLNQADLNRQYREILADYTIAGHEKTRRHILTWFDQFENVHPDDLLFSIDLCKRMALAIEDRFYRENPNDTDRESVGLHLSTLEECRNLCDELLKRNIELYSISKTQVVRDAVQYIATHYNEELSLSALAAHVHLSPEYFSRLFKSEMGENFSVFVMSFRLKKAREMIQTTDMKISYIAARVGYPTPGYFSKIYKKYLGLTPEQDRAESKMK